LYRHFPAREELLVAVYRSQMEKLAAAERTFADTSSPVEALRAWLSLFVNEELVALTGIEPVFKP
jgi:AcrR family transcriptional regulator